MMTMDSLKARYTDVLSRVSAAAGRTGRKGSDIVVVAVSKYAEPEQVRELIALGHVDFGESRVQGLVQRAATVDEMFGRQLAVPQVAAAHRAVRAKQNEGDGLPTLPAATRVRWHMIGHLQKNKVRKVVGLARLIHSVDSLRLIEEIQAAAVKRDEVVDVLVQVNCSGEKSKHGCAVAAALHLCEQAESTIHVRVRGLMTMAALTDDASEARAAFDRCRELYDDAHRNGIGGEHFNILSMGMSNDFEAAIECGANMVRIGSAIFGEPPHGTEETEEDDED
ncbi:MAG TPA: YggS family pyridoxal phosphate-dependent enzyme [Phycisphaerales bacterium]|nr:YggS family pyridoxal phosphate-dependent enzyme [Phycisphaerales bacterium]